MNDLAPSEGTLLIVDDSAANLAFLNLALERQGFRVRTAANGDAALADIAQVEPDLILLDVNMPGMSGYEVCQHLKNSETTRAIPVIFITSRSDIPDKLEAFSAGGVDYLTKPYQVEELVARVRAHLQWYQEQRQLTRQNQELRALASHDDLTGLANRRRFQESLEQEWRRLARDKEPLSLILSDVDFFKGYNDHYGHPAGDDCLRRVGAILRESLHRAADLAARYGGEEFAILLPNTTAEGARRIANTVQQRLQMEAIRHQYSAVAAHVTLSQGIACVLPHADQPPSGLIALADQALYAAKQQGRHRIVMA